MLFKISILYVYFIDFQIHFFLEFYYFKEINTTIITQNNELKLKA